MKNEKKKKKTVHLVTCFNFILFSCFSDMVEGSAVAVVLLHGKYKQTSYDGVGDTCHPSAPSLSVVFACFFSFTETDEAAWLLLLDGGAVAAGGVECWVDWGVLGMVVDKQECIDR